MRVMWIVLLLAGCGTLGPAVVGDRDAAKFKADLAACNESAGKAVYLRNAKHVLSWVTSQLFERGEMHQAVTACMLKRGYPGAPDADA